MAKLTFIFHGISLFFDITFNETGKIIQMETKRYMDEKTIKPWIIKVENYRELNSVMKPIEFEVLWRLEKEDFSYAKFNVTEVEYEKPEKFLYFDKVIFASINTLKDKKVRNF